MVNQRNTNGKERTHVGMAIFLLFSLMVNNVMATPFDEEIIITPNDRNVRANFGNSIAVSENIVIVGASGESLDGSEKNTLKRAGAAYIFEKTEAGWVQKQQLIASDAEAGAEFGVSVSIWGNYAVVGAHKKDGNELAGSILSDAGAAYIFKKNENGEWIETQKLSASDTGTGDFFGYSVGISENTVVIGAPLEDQSVMNNDELGQSGSAYIFEEGNDGVWYQEQKITASDRGVESYFGNAVSIYKGLIVVGADLEGEDERNENTMTAAGAVYFFEKGTAADWQETQKVVASDRESGDFFGWTVSIYENICVVGAYQDNTSTNNNAGSAYIFKYNEGSNWEEMQKLTDPTGESGANFGSSVSVNMDFVAVGSAFGAKVHLFKKENTESWKFIRDIPPLNSNKRGLFGCALALSKDLIFIGASAENKDENNENKVNGAGALMIVTQD